MIGRAASASVTSQCRCALAAISGSVGRPWTSRKQSSQIDAVNSSVRDSHNPRNAVTARSCSPVAIAWSISFALRFPRPLAWLRWRVAAFFWPARRWV